MLEKNRTVVILAGGKSRRMGSDKAALPVMRGTMLDFIIRRYSEVFSEVILAAGVPGRYDTPGITQIYDEYPGGGPMAGLHAAFKHTDAEHVFLTAVDTPFSSPRLAAWLYDEIGDAPACIVRRGGLLEPLYGVYSRSLSGKIERCLKNSENSLLNIIDAGGAKILDADALPCSYSLDELFFNVNSPPDYERALPLFKYYGDTDKPVISVVANSGTGKTTYLERLIPELKKRGFTLGVIKHDAHRFEIDIPGKDSWRMTKAGADIVAVSSPEKTAVIERHEQSVPLNGLVRRMASANLIISEGYKTGFKPKIEIFRAELGQPRLCGDNELLAVVSDDNPKSRVPALSFSDVSSMADLIADFASRFRPL